MLSSKLQEKIVEAAEDAGREYQVVIEVPSEKIYEEYKNYIEKIPQQLGADVLVNILEDGVDRYWCVNVDYKLIDQLGQVREIGCIQVDIGNAPRLKIHYIDEKGQRKDPVIIHSAIPGGIERYLYLLFDQQLTAVAAAGAITTASGWRKLCRGLPKARQEVPKATTED